MNDTPAINAQNLTKRFGDFTAVDGVNFEVYPGEIFGFLGPNGSGKTTSIRMMLGLMKPTSGEVQVLGMEVDGDTARIRPRVGYMSQRFSLYNDLTVLQNLNFYGAAYGLKNNELGERINDAMLMAGLEGREHAKTKDLSGGWRQRLALSAAILHRPEVLFLDEPTAGMNPEELAEMMDIIRQVHDELNLAIFLIEHRMKVVMDLCDVIQTLVFGEVIAEGTPEEIRNNPKVIDAYLGKEVET